MTPYQLLSKRSFIHNQSFIVNSDVRLDNPAPCTLFYLAQCRHESDCKYAHDYILEEEDYQELKENARKTPCRVTNEGLLSSIRSFPCFSSVFVGEICTFGDACVYGHVCPQGTTCYYLKLGICKFQAGWYSIMSWNSSLTKTLYSWNAPATEQLITVRLSRAIK